MCLKLEAMKTENETCAKRKWDYRKWNKSCVFVSFSFHSHTPSLSMSLRFFLSINSF
jgi:hypothetical protein